MVHLGNIRSHIRRRRIQVRGRVHRHREHPRRIPQPVLVQPDLNRLATAAGRDKCGGQGVRRGTLTRARVNLRVRREPGRNPSHRLAGLVDQLDRPVRRRLPRGHARQPQRKHPTRGGLLRPQNHRLLHTRRRRLHPKVRTRQHARVRRRLPRHRRRHRRCAPASPYENTRPRSNAPSRPSRTRAGSAAEPATSNASEFAFSRQRPSPVRANDTSMCCQAPVASR